MAAETVNAKYVFLDIVGYSRGRTIEAQSHIIDALNAVLKDAVTGSGVPKEQVLLLPTGDGVGVVLLDVTRPYDVDVKLALEILRLVDQQNAQQQDKQRRFQVRVGVNENIDNLVTDVNGNRNVTGLGINQAQRIMSAGDGANILVGQVVAERLSQRDQYQGRLRELRVTAKHGVTLRVCQLVDSSIPYLNSYEPAPLREEEADRIPKFLAYYMALLVRHNLFIRGHLAPREAVALVPMFALLAHDAAEPLPPKPGKPLLTRVPSNLAGDLPGLLDHYVAIDVWLLEAFVRAFTQANIGAAYRHFFEGPYGCLLVSDEGRRVLVRDWPDVCSDLGVSA